MIMFVLLYLVILVLSTTASNEIFACCCSCCGCGRCLHSWLPWKIHSSALSTAPLIIDPCNILRPARLSAAVTTINQPTDRSEYRSTIIPSTFVPATSQPSRQMHSRRRGACRTLCVYRDTCTISNELIAHCDKLAGKSVLARGPSNEEFLNCQMQQLQQQILFARSK